MHSLTCEFGTVFGQPIQIDTVGTTTQYITVTIGGNDVGFSDLGEACSTLEVGPKIYQISKTSCSTQIANSTKDLQGLAGENGKLAQLYTQLLERSAPGSELVVAGYPGIFPKSFKGLGKLKGKPFCTFDHLRGVATFGMYVTNAQKVSTFEQDLNATIEASVQAVAVAYPGRIKYSNIYPTSVPRNCKGTTANATVTGLELSPGRTGTGPKHLVSTATFHPTKAGQQVYAKAIEKTFQAFAALRKTINFVDAPGTGAPPATLGPYTMSTFTNDPNPDYTQVTSIAGPTGTLQLSDALEVLTVGQSWNTWSNGFTGSVYWVGWADQGSAASVTITLPPHTGAVYFYAEPDEYETFDMSASANNGTTSGDQTVFGNSGASYFGFYAAPGVSISTITISCPDDFAIGEFGIAAN